MKTSDYNTAFQFHGGFLGWTTRKVELPVKWSELVKKYKDIVPPHAQYLKNKFKLSIIRTGNAAGANY